MLYSSVLPRKIRGTTLNEQRTAAVHILPSPSDTIYYDCPSEGHCKVTCHCHYLPCEHRKSLISCNISLVRHVSGLANMVLNNDGSFNVEVSSLSMF